MLRPIGSLLAALTLAALAPSLAHAHATVTETEPGRGAALERQPRAVTFRFSEPVETRFGAVRVFDSRGERVDTGERLRRSDDSSGVRLRSRLADGAYTATYSVISADSHPVSGGFTFTVGEAGGTPAAAVADLIDDVGAGPVTATAFGAVRALAYLATALLAGGLIFLLLAWRGALAATAKADSSWAAASAAFSQRVTTVMLAAALAGALVSLAGIVLQGATATGTSFWSALEGSVLQDVLRTRFGSVWGIRAAGFAALAMLALGARRRGAVPALVPATLGATGLAVRSPPRVWWAAAATAASAVAITPGLAGHAGAQDPSWLLLIADAAHVLAMSVWVGGVALLLIAVPAATRLLAAGERGRLLAGTLERFSAIALAAVALLLATGILQSIIQLRAFSDLLDTAFGRAILVKSALFVALVGLGALNRRRLLPRLRRVVDGGAGPGEAGVAIRSSLRGELTLMVAAVAVAAALVSYSPSAGAGATGPFSTARDLGPARLELTVEPARVGPNEIHLYLFDARTGAQYDRARQVEVKSSLAEKKIGPLELQASKTGPGHYTVRGAALAPAGKWRITIEALISEFELLTTDVEVDVR